MLTPSARVAPARSATDRRSSAGSPKVHGPTGASERPCPRKWKKTRRPVTALASGRVPAMSPPRPWAKTVTGSPTPVTSCSIRTPDGVEISSVGGPGRVGRPERGPVGSGRCRRGPPSGGGGPNRLTGRPTSPETLAVRQVLEAGTNVEQVDQGSGDADQPEDPERAAGQQREHDADGEDRRPRALGQRADGLETVAPLGQTVDQRHRLHHQREDHDDQLDVVLDGNVEDRRGRGHEGKSMMRAPASAGAR